MKDRAQGCGCLARCRCGRPAAGSAIYRSAWCSLVRPSARRGRAARAATDLCFREAPLEIRKFRGKSTNCKINFLYWIICMGKLCSLNNAHKTHIHRFDLTLWLLTETRNQQFFSWALNWWHHNDEMCFKGVFLSLAESKVSLNSNRTGASSRTN